MLYSDKRYSAARYSAARCSDKPYSDVRYPTPRRNFGYERETNIDLKM